LKKYIIYAPSYSEYSGGAIVLHKLCDLLNKNQQQAYIWPMGKPITFNFIEYIYYAYIKLKDLFKVMLYGRTKPKYLNPIADKEDLIDSVIVYPETVNGNPLKAKHVVRWFLNKPGAITGKINYGKEELSFYFQEAFKDHHLNRNSDDKLMVTDFNEDVFSQTNFGKREGRCFILRKGKNRQLKHNIQKHEIVDTLSHKKMAKVFNKVEYCYSYDMHTMYSVFASMCGCKSVVVPESDMSLDEWQPIKELRYGIAYGEDGIDKAVVTREKMIQYQKEKVMDSLESVQQFIKKSQSFFAEK